MPTFEEVIKRDNALMSLATYDASDGLMVGPMDSREQAMEFQEKIRERFNLWKRLIQMGEMEYETIEQDVLNRNGPFYQASRGPKTIDEMCFEAIEEAEQREQSDEAVKKLTEQWSNALYEKLMGIAAPRAELPGTGESNNNEERETSDKPEREKPDDQSDCGSEPPTD